MNRVAKLFEIWKENVEDPSLREELLQIEEQGDDEDLNDRFYRDLSFDTAGLRGIIGAGTNRMNIYTVGRATQGFADYLNAHFANPSVAIARDSRHMGETFTKHAACVFAANGVKAYLYPRIEPTPALSFAVRDLGCAGGVCVTASHNPAPYNGYKAYGPDGCQIATQASEEISSAIEAVDTFADVKTCDFDDALASGLIEWIDESTLDRFLDAVASCSVESAAANADLPDVKVAFTPLNGTGLECVGRILNMVGIDDVTIVPEQKDPDGDFPTCPYPNPETREALELGIALCKKVHPDLLIATDPDADRMGIAVENADDYAILSGNEIGVLLLDYVARMRRERGEDLSRSVAVTTIVSSMMVDALAEEYSFEVRRVLTGFKYIGSIIGELEESGEEDRFVFGFEESYGYLSGPHVRDKDAINASMLACQMARRYKSEGLSLVDGMNRLYERYGYFLNKTNSYSYPGASGAENMKRIMENLRSHAPAEIAGLKVLQTQDYAPGIKGLPPADVLEFDLEGNNKVLVRPSGTEPKVKVYLFAKHNSRAAAEELLSTMEDYMGNLMR